MPIYYLRINIIYASILFTHQYYLRIDITMMTAAPSVATPNPK